MHDFAITENFAVFLDLPMVVQPQNFLKGKVPIGFDDTLGARWGGGDAPKVFARPAISRLGAIT